MIWVSPQQPESADDMQSLRKAIRTKRSLVLIKRRPGWLLSLDRAENVFLGVHYQTREGQEGNPKLSAQA